MHDLVKAVTSIRRKLIPVPSTSPITINRHSPPDRGLLLMPPSSLIKFTFCETPVNHVACGVKGGLGDAGRLECVEEATMACDVAVVVPSQPLIPPTWKRTVPCRFSSLPPLRSETGICGVSSAVSAFEPQKFALAIEK